LASSDSRRQHFWFFRLTKSRRIFEAQIERRGFRIASGMKSGSRSRI
jgi:hypothetical protein